jgi:hypothetical protein
VNDERVDMKHVVHRDVQVVDVVTRQRQRIKGRYIRTLDYAATMSASPARFPAELPPTEPDDVKSPGLQSFTDRWAVTKMTTLW